MENYLALIITAMLSLGAGAAVMWVVINNLQKTKAHSIIKEAEEQYNIACDSCVPVEELDRLEKHYKDSLRLLKLYKSKEEKID
jgi:uncharacterized pyridoxal phosphate-containing UPF0001 family protein